MQAVIEISFWLISLCLSGCAIWVLASMFLAAAVSLAASAADWLGWGVLVFSLCALTLVGFVAGAIWDVMWWRIAQL